MTYESAVSRRGFLKPASFGVLGVAIAFGLLPHWLQIVIVMIVLGVVTVALFGILALFWYHRI